MSRENSSVWKRCVLMERNVYHCPTTKGRRDIIYGAWLNVKYITEYFLFNTWAWSLWVL